MPARGPQTAEELFAILRTAVDPLYLQAFLVEGGGSGLEAFEQICEQLARASLAIDRTTQALYILPWSGQSNPPSAGASLATVELTLMRTKRTEFPLTIRAGEVQFEEIATDFGPGGGIEVPTGRRFTLAHDFTFLPGERGPVTVPAISTRPGFGYTNVMPGSIRRIVQPGTGLGNGGATVAVGAVTARLIFTPFPDVVGPQQVGQHLVLIGGTNAGAQRLIEGYEGATPGVNGGVAVLSPELVARATVTPPAGTFILGERVDQVDTAAAPPGVVASGTVLAVTDGAGAPPWWIVVRRDFGTFVPTAGTIGAITGTSSGATFTLEDVSQQPALANDVGGASWQVLDWAADLGATVTNDASPAAGDLAMLDALGDERAISRAPGEPDILYRKRVHTLADVVSPAAIRRIINRVLAPFGLSGCLRETGLELWRGMYFDGDPLRNDPSFAFFFDLDSVLVGGPVTGTFFTGERVEQLHGDGTIAVGRALVDVVTGLVDGYTVNEGTFVANPAEPIVGTRSGASQSPAAVTGGLHVRTRYLTMVDFEEMRAFFLVTVPPMSLGEFGIPFDVPHPHNAFDANPYLTAFDGSPATAAVLRLALYSAIDRARAGGVGFDIVEDAIGCV